MIITNSVTMLEITENGGTIYPTLISGDGHLVLVDAGFPGQTDAIMQAIAEAGFRAEELTEIIITHQDFDHIGCLRDLLNLAPKAKVLAHIEEAPYIDGNKTPAKLAARLAEYDTLSDEMKARCDSQKELYPKLTAAVTQTLTDGEVLPCCGGIEIIHTPGHTPGHICLYLRESRVMVGGDTLNISDGHITGPNPQHTYDMELGLKSFEKAKAYDFRGLISYHCGYLEILK